MQLYRNDASEWVIRTYDKEVINFLFLELSEGSSLLDEEICQKPQQGLSGILLSHLLLWRRDNAKQVDKAIIVYTAVSLCKVYRIECYSVKDDVRVNNARSRRIKTWIVFPVFLSMKMLLNLFYRRRQGKEENDENTSSDLNFWWLGLDKERM